MQVGAASDPLLYDLKLRFDANHVRPLRRYDASSRTLTVRSDSALDREFSVDLRHGAMHMGSDGDSDHGSDLALALARGLPLDLSLALGACDATLDFSNLAVRRLHLRTGASESTVTFGTPNAVAMSTLDIGIGAASLTVHQLGNAHADSVRIATRVGSADLDLAGNWTGTMHLTVTAALASVVLHVPNDVGIESRVATTLGSVSAPSLASRNGAAYSANWNTATRKVVIAGKATLANLTLLKEKVSP